MGLHHIKKLCTTKETINRVKRQLAVESEKRFAIHISDKGLTTKDIRDPYITKSQITQFLKDKGLELTFHQKDIQKLNRCIK